MRIFKYILFSLLALIILVVTTLFIVVYFYEDELKQIVISELNKSLATEVKVEKVDFSVIKQFPNASLEFVNVVVKSSKDFNEKEFVKHQTDTLLFAQSLFLEFNIWDILNKKYIVRKIKAENGKICTLIDSQGNDNYDFWKNDTQSGVDNFKLELDDVKLFKMEFYSSNKIKNLVIDASIKNASLNGEFTSSDYSLDASLKAYFKKFTIDNVNYINSREIETKTSLDVKNSVYTITKGRLQIAGLTFVINGNINNKEENANLNLNFKGNDINIKTLMSLLPKDFQTSINEYESSGNFYFDCNVSGMIDKYQNPHIEADFGIKEGEITRKNSTLKFKNVNAKGSYSNGKANASASSVLSLNSLSASIGGSSFSGDFSMKNFINPDVIINANLNFDLEEYQHFFKIDSVEKISGKVNGTIHYEGKYKDLSKITEDDIKNSITEGNINLTDFSVRLTGNPYEISNCSAKGYFKNNYLSLDSLMFKIGNNDFRFTGNLKNIISYILLKDQKLYMNGAMKSSEFNLSDFMKPGSDDNLSGTILPEDIIFDLTLKVGHFVYDKFEATELSARARCEGNILVARSVNFNSTGGVATGDLSVEILPDKNTHFSCTANLDKINIDKLFWSFDNFGQDFILNKHLRGKLNATLNYSSDWDKNLDIIPGSILANGSIVITNGELVDFEPMQELSAYIEVSELKHIKFSTLKNDIVIKDRVVTIPQMDINSSAFNIQVSGKHDFDNKFEYSVKVLLSEVLARNAKKAKKENEEFGVVEDDGLGRTSIYLLISGTPDDYKITYDRKQTGKHIKESIQEEKQNLKQILNEEFGWFKNDTTLKKKPEEKKNNSNFQIKWDEDAPKEKFDEEDD